MQLAYEPWLVLLSIVMAIQGAYVGFTLAGQLGGATGVRRRVLLAGAAFSLAVAIWTMHFVGMLAARIPFPVDYLVFPTLLSFWFACLWSASLCLPSAVAPFLCPPDFVRLLDGHRHLYHALHRNDGAARECTHGACAALCRCELGHRSCSIRIGALAGDRPDRPSAVDFVLGGVRHCGFGDALYGHGGHDAVPDGDVLVGCAGALDRPFGDRCCVVAFCVSGIFLLVLYPSVRARCRCRLPQR